MRSRNREWSAYLRFSAVCVSVGVVAGSAAVMAGHRWYSFFVVGSLASFTAWVAGVVAFLAIGVFRSARSS
jgi:hypothetical protein